VFSIRGANNGWLKGFIIGLFYIVISFMLFSALYQNLDVDMGIFNDVVLGSATGLVSGIMCANIKK
jgi:putative membrane protein (TIGR04086 family)